MAGALHYRLCERSSADSVVYYLLHGRMCSVVFRWQYPSNCADGRTDTNQYSLAPAINAACQWQWNIMLYLMYSSLCGTQVYFNGVNIAVTVINLYVTQVSETCDD